MEATKKQTPVQRAVLALHTSSGRAVKAPLETWIAAIVRSMSPTQRDQVLNTIDQFNALSSVPSAAPNVPIIGGG